MLDRVVLDRVVLLGPALAGVVGGVVCPAGQDRAGVVVDQRPLETGRLQRVVVATGVVTVSVGRLGRVAHLADHDLVHLADLLLQRHPVKQVVDSIVDRRMPVQVARLSGARRGRRHAQRRDCEQRDHPADRRQGAAHGSSSMRFRKAQPGAAPRSSGGTRIAPHVQQVTPVRDRKQREDLSSFRAEPEGVGLRQSTRRLGWRSHVL